MKKQHRGSVSERRAGRRGGASASPRRLVAAVATTAKPRAGEAKGSVAVVERFGAARARAHAIPIPLTLEEACLLVGQGVEAERFAVTALESLAEEMFSVAGDCVDDSPVLMALAERTKLAARVARLLSE